MLLLAAWACLPHLFTCVFVLLLIRRKHLNLLRFCCCLASLSSDTFSPSCCSCGSCCSCCSCCSCMHQLPMPSSTLMHPQRQQCHVDGTGGWTHCKGQVGVHRSCRHWLALLFVASFRRSVGPSVCQSVSVSVRPFDSRAVSIWSGLQRKEEDRRRRRRNLGASTLQLPMGTRVFRPWSWPCDLPLVWPAANNESSHVAKEDCRISRPITHSAAARPGSWSQASGRLTPTSAASSPTGTLGTPDV